MDISQANKGRKKRSRSFQAKLFMQFSAAGFAFAIIAAFAFAYLASAAVKDLYQKEGLQAAENFARLSELALLYDSGENAREAALATLDFPSIKHVAVINKEQQILLDEGSTNEKISNSLLSEDWNNNGAIFLSSNDKTWQIAAPVYTEYADHNDDSMILEDTAPADEYLGYIVIQVDTTELTKFQTEIFVKNLLVGLAYGLAFVFALNFTLIRALKPLNELTSVMAASSDGAYKKAAIDTDAAEEVVKIADVYNHMIGALSERDHRLRGQKDLLETEVTLRTSELVHARDAALEANRHKSEFLANVTHELRTPLQSIIGYSEVIAEILEDEGLFDCDDDIRKITSNADHLLTLINSILDISKIEAGKMEVNYCDIDIKPLLVNACDTISPLVEKNGNQLKTQFDLPDTPLSVDEKKIFQMVLNLLSNAAKFTHDGVIELSACVRQKNQQPQLIVNISDTGIGIDEEKQRIIFEPFRQIDGSESREFVGTGLGLSITMRFAKLLGGDIQLESSVGKGSRFELSIPCQRVADRDGAITEVSPEDASGATVSNTTVHSNNNAA